MITKTLSIGSRGQITLPKKLRDLFKTNTIVLELVDNQHAVISPVPDVGGVISGVTGGVGAITVSSGCFGRAVGTWFKAS